MSLPKANRRPSVAALLVHVCLAAVLLSLTVTLSGCASSGASVKAGRQAEDRQEWDRAVIEYTNAAKQRPNDANLRAALARVKLRASLDHFNKGRRLAGTGKLEEGLTELQVAAELNPSNAEIDDQMRQVRSALRSKIAVTREGKTHLETLIDQANETPLPGSEVPRIKLADSLVFRNASVRDIFTAIGHFTDISMVFDPEFRDKTLTIDLRNSSLEDALNAVSAATRTFYRVSSPKSITIVPDTPAKRREYEEEIIRTFYLSNADPKEVLDVLRLVVDNRRLGPIQGINAITIKDTPEKILAAAKVISAIDKARAEVVIDVELVQVERTQLQEFGLQIASPNASGPPTGIDGSADVNRQGLTLNDLKHLGAADVIMTGVPALYYKALKNDSHTRVLANPQLRTSEGLPAQAKFGERVPVPTVTFTPIATGGVNQQPITSYTYENIGVNIDITPRLHHNDEVSLNIKLEVSNVSGTGFNNLPTFGERSINTTIRLKDGETNMLAGLIRDDERRSLAGVPGLVDIPVVGRLFAANHRDSTQTDIVMMITPRIVRVLDLTEADLRPFRVGRDAGSGLVEFPLPAQPQAAPPGVPPRDQPEGAPVDEPAPGGIRPPRTGAPGTITPSPSTPSNPPTPSPAPTQPAPTKPPGPPN
jgi:general secretion pathway protein D